ncbi:response regulator transcription factor [Synergistaceae bacterium OttesenSCG-928-I11]|nr:response regulator transcription factor [Synergistaceae bacterium OttesenSCG-928-I11]
MGTRVFLADDHKLFLSGLRAVLQNETWIDVVGTASDGSQALEEIKRLRPDIVVVDISMPEMNGIEVIKRMAGQGVTAKPLILSMHLDKRIIKEALLAGAMGYILKESDEAAFIEAVRAVRDGGYYFSGDALQIVMEDYLAYAKGGSPTSRRESNPLSNREVEVLKLMASGHSTRDISRELHIGKTTVDTHRRNIMEKLQCENVADLTRYAIREGLVEIE